MVNKCEWVNEVIIVDVLTIIAIREEVLVDLLLPLLFSHLIIEQIFQALVIDHHPRLALVSHTHEVLLELG